MAINKICFLLTQLQILLELPSSFRLLLVMDH